MGNCVKKEGSESEVARGKRTKGDENETASSNPRISRPEPDHPLYVAQYDYDCRSDDDFSFKKGDLLYIISTEEGDWWFAQHKDTGQKGFIPSNYVGENHEPAGEE